MEDFKPDSTVNIDGHQTKSDAELFAERRRNLMLKLAAGAFAIPVVLKKMTAKASAGTIIT